MGLSTSTSTSSVREATINRIGCANQRALESAAGKFLECQFGGEARLGSLRILLRHVDVDTHLLNGGDVKQLRGRAAAPELIRCPTSVLRAVITPSNGA